MGIKTRIKIKLGLAERCGIDEGVDFLRRNGVDIRKLNLPYLDITNYSSDSYFRSFYDLRTKLEKNGREIRIKGVYIFTPMQDSEAIKKYGLARNSCVEINYSQPQYNNPLQPQ